MTHRLQILLEGNVAQSIAVSKQPLAVRCQAFARYTFVRWSSVLIVGG
jgi:hypothetical protein